VQAAVATLDAEDEAELDELLALLDVLDVLLLDFELLELDTEDEL